MIRTKQQLIKKMKLVKAIDKLMKDGYKESTATAIACGYTAGRKKNYTPHARIVRALRANGMAQGRAERIARKLLE